MSINDRLVRGLDYYTRTAFEFTHGALGAQNAILGGGRYDGLSEALGGPAAPGIGFAIGEDRLVMSLHGIGGVGRPQAGRLHRPARRGHESRSGPPGARTAPPRSGGRTRRRIFQSEKIVRGRRQDRRRYILIVGENEVKADAFALKHLASGEQVTVPRDRLGASELRNRSSWNSFVFLRALCGLMPKARTTQGHEGARRNSFLAR